jgi:hypothetical protein
MSLQGQILLLIELKHIILVLSQSIFKLYFAINVSGPDKNTLVPETRVHGENEI